VNRERAGTYLRLVAEAELRRARTPPPIGGAMSPAAPGVRRRAVVLRRSDVAAALYDMPRHQRDVIALQYYGNLSEAETAAALRISRGAVHSHAAAGMAGLRAALQTGISCRVAQVARVLTAVGAIDGEVADQILDEFVAAFSARRAGAAGQPGPDPRPLLRSPGTHLPVGMLIGSRPPAASVQPAGRRVLRRGGGRPGTGRGADGSRPGRPARPGDPGPRR
jgi:Sigma-70, region 4